MKKIKSLSLNIKGAVLDRNMLCNYLEKLASEQIVRGYSDETTYPIRDLKNNFNIISNTYSILNEHAKLKILIEPAGEWILDNFYIIEERAKFIEKELTEKRYKNLNGIASGRYKGFARIYVLAEEIVNYTDGKIDEDGIKLFLSSYQRKKLLTIEEIWSFPIFLSLAIIQNIREICDKIASSQVQKYKVESIIERLVEQKEKNKLNFKNQVKITKKINERMSYAYIEYLSYKLKSYGKKGIPYLNILEEQINKIGLSVGDVIKQVHFTNATNKVSMGNLIISLKEISHMDFAEISKQIGGIEEVLLQDPSGVYEKMDYNTKNDYQSKIREISRKSNISEIYIAKTLLDMAKIEKEKNARNLSEPERKMQEKRSHIGYFLFEDINTLYKKLEIRRKETNYEEKSKLYMGANIILPLYFCFLFYVLFYSKSRNFILSLLSVIILYLPLTEIVMQVIVYILSKIVKPKRIPKLDFSSGVPEEAATFVVIPTILQNREKVKEIAKKLEVYSLANKSKNIYYAILGDVTAGDKQEENFDKEIIEEGLKQVKNLNKKYQSEDFNIFHFLYRKRTWNSKEACYLGWERKRGLLIQFNEFLRDASTNDFRVNTIINQLEFMPKIKYIITLDADTNLVLNSGLELIGAMEHVLNMPIAQSGRVVSGHAILQPRIGIDLNSSFSSGFSKIFANGGGTEPYTNAVSDVYQDNFDEGIYTGKGIYNLQMFSDIVTNQIPENTVLSHDLLEGSYLRCGLASDILLLDGFPSKYNSFMTRLSRWIRGDWQILKWITSKIKIRNGTYCINPLNPLSKFKILDNLRRSLAPVGILILILAGMLRPNTPDGELIIVRTNCSIYSSYSSYSR